MRREEIKQEDCLATRNPARPYHHSASTAQATEAQDRKSSELRASELQEVSALQDGVTIV